MRKTLALILSLVLCLSVGLSATSALAQEDITLRFLAWGIGTAEENGVTRQMLAEFTNRFGIKIEILEVPKNADGTDMSYTQYLTTLASQQQLPDVFMQTSIPDTVSSGWAYNISEYAQDDPEYLSVVEALRNGGVINGHVYSVPASMHMVGMAQNLSLMEELNLDPLGYTYTMDELAAQIAACTTATTKGIHGISMADWGVFALDPSKGMGWFTFDGEKYNHASPEFAEVIGIFRDIVTKGQTSHDAYTDPTTWMPEGMTAGQAWPQGLVGFSYMATYELGAMMRGELPFEADLFPLPNETMVVLPDNYFIGANTAHPAEAYKLASWLTYSTEGVLQKIEFIKNTEGASFSGVPINPGYVPEVDAFFLESYQNMPNFMKMYNALNEKPENVVVEIFKTTPGYANSRWDADTGVIGTVDGEQKSLTMSQLLTQIIKGQLNLADYAADIERITNRCYQDAVEVLKDF